MRLGRGLLVAVAACAAVSLALGAANAQTAVKTPVPKPAAPAAAPAAKTAAPDEKAKPSSVAASEKVLPATSAGGRVVVMRGLANVWSRGMDVLAKKFSEQGVQVILINHAAWRKVADEIIAQYKTEKGVLPVIIIGHSLGADAALVMSNWFGVNGVPVRLIVTFDGVADTHPLTGNVDEVINYYKGSGWGQVVEGAKSFKGTISNVDLRKRPDIGHLNIEKDPVLQGETLAKVLEILKVKPKAKLTAASD